MRLLSPPDLSGRYTLGNMNHDSAFVNAFDHLSPEEKKQLALLGSMLARPVSEEEQEIQRLLDACVDAREKGLSLGTSEGKGPLS